MTYCGHPVKGTFNFNRAIGEELQASPLLQTSKSGKKSYLCQQEENNNWRDFQAVVMLHRVRAPRSKKANSGP